MDLLGVNLVKQAGSRLGVDHWQRSVFAAEFKAMERSP